MRSRNVKPGFFLNEKLAECDFETRLLFIGLWCYADREGRFEWIPKRIEAAIFPYDKNVNVDKCLCNLMSLHLITLSTHGDNKIGYIENFKKHQKPHPHEAQSVLPPKPAVSPCEQTPPLRNDMVGQCSADIRKEDIRKEDIRKESSPILLFSVFWDIYPRKIKMGMCETLWVDIFQGLDNSKSLDLYNKIITSIGEQKKTWNDPQYIPSPDNWLRDKRWLDVTIISVEEKKQTTCPLCNEMLSGTRYVHNGKKICGKCDMKLTRERLNFKKGE